MRNDRARRLQSLLDVSAGTIEVGIAVLPDAGCGPEYRLRHRTSDTSGLPLALPLSEGLGVTSADDQLAAKLGLEAV